MTSSIFDILKQRLTPLYPEMAGQSAMPDTHGQMVAQGQQQNDGLGSLLRTGASLAAGAFGEKPETFDASRYSEAADQTPAPSGRELGIGSGRDMSATGPGLGETPTPPPANQYADFLANAGPATSSAVGSGRGLETAPTPTPTPTPQVAEQPALQRILSRREKLEQDIADIQGKQYHAAVYRGPNGETSSKPKEGYVLEKAAGKNRDKSHNFIDVLKGIGLGALQGAAAGGLPGLIGGAAAGGVASGVNASADNRMWDDIKIAGLRSELEAERNNEIGAYRRDKAQADAVNTQAEVRKKNQELAEKRYKELEAVLGEDGVIDDNDQRLLNEARAGMGMPGQVSAHDKREIEYKDVEGQVFERRKGSGDEWKPSQLPADRLKQGHVVQTPRGNTVVATGPQVLTSDTNIAVGDAERQVRVDISNRDKWIDVQKTNIANEMKYQDDVRAQINKIAEANADIVADNTEIQNLNKEVQEANAELQKAAAAGDEYGFNAAKVKFDSALAKFSEALGKVKPGLAADLKRGMPKRQKQVEFKPVKTVNVGPKVPKSKDPAGLYQ